MSRWSKMGFSACRCSESFWLRETVSKHLMAPDVDTIHGRTFSSPTLEITSRFEASEASLKSSLSPDRAAATPELLSSVTDDM